MVQSRTKIQDGGRVVIPAEYRKALGLRVGDEVIVSLQDDEVSLFAPRRGIKRAQELLRRYVPKGRFLSEELIAERQAEGKGE